VPHCLALQNIGSNIFLSSWTYCLEQGLAHAWRPMSECVNALSLMQVEWLWGWGEGALWVLALHNPAYITLGKQSYLLSLCFLLCKMKVALSLSGLLWGLK
jgi:hypothetical protein